MSSASSTSSGRNRKPGCIPCRERHLKCDHALPACSNCQKPKVPLQCVYAPKSRFRLRESEYTSRVTQRSPSLQDKTDEKEQLGRAEVLPYPSSSPFPTQDAAATLTGENVPPAGRSDSLVASSSFSSDDAGGIVFQPSRESQQWLGATSPPVQGLPPGVPEGELGHPKVGQYMSIDRFLSPPQISPSHSQSRRVVSDDVDCKVFGYYMEHAGPWLDIVSPNRCFGQKVPRIALVEPVLFYASLAYASRVLVLHGELDKARGEYYDGKAIEHLIPLLSSRSAASRNEALLATTTILRMSEQFSEMKDDAQYHLHGAFSLFATGSGWSPLETSLGAAAFWVYLRESIRICFLNEQPCQFDLSFYEDSTAFAAASDEVWSNRMTYLLARVCSACWGSPNSPGHINCSLDNLKDQVEQWKRGIPDTFEPWYLKQAEYEPFPTVRYISTWHVVAWQFYYTAKVMLALYGESRQNTNFIAMNRYMETEVLVPSRWLCATTFGCNETGAVLNGTHLVAWCAQFFSGREEQRRVMEFLQGFMARTKWPNQTCCDRLQRIWGGGDGAWVQA